MHEILIYFALKYQGNWDQIYQALESKEKVSLGEVKQTGKTVRENDWKIITILDYDYPEQLKKTYKPPFVLWFKGDRKLLDEKLITITGNFLDPVSKDRIKNVVTKILDSHFLLAANLNNIDQEVIKCTKDKPVTYVLARGFQATNAPEKTFKGSNNLIITEYPPETEAKKVHFAQRNRIISALGDSLVLVNSKKDHGINSLITNFLNLGKEIYCFPGDGNSNDGNSQLIKQGAHLITQPEDLFA